MGKTTAERKKKQMERLKASGKYEKFKEREKNKLKERRLQKKKQMTIEEKEASKAKKREEMRKYRANKSFKLLKTNDVLCSEKSSPSKVFKSPQAFGKAISKVKKNLPKSPNKSKAVIIKLAQQIEPNIVQASLPKSRISKIYVEQVKAFYEKDNISYQAPGRKDFVRKFHSFIKIDDYILKASNISLNPKQYTKFNMRTGESEDMKMGESEERKMSESDKKKIDESVEMCEDSPVKIYEIKIGNWILVPFSGKCKMKHFAAQVLDREEKLIKVKFLQKKGSCFIWPLKDDISYIDSEIKAIILPEPDFDRRGYLTFKNFDFSNFIMG